MKNWTIADGQDRRVYLINDGRDAVGEIVFCETRRPEDARLIAAAPELLAAARTALGVLTSEDLDPQDAIDELEQAIANATGGSA